ncbi:uncharacterized protein PFLUO_LOCUS2539 [Penicillium psychrofluorescens]|uniref:uncharacterized protein n=1 Tax=Penicillium psychrofluorescens TaxID=3158075 RepID=UPI003CCD29B6
MANNRLPNPNRYITDSDVDGNSFFSTDLPASVEAGSELGGGVQRLVYQTEPPPVSLSGKNDLERYKTALQSKAPLVSPVPPGGGTNVWYNDIPPGGESPMHRTVSLDFIIVLIGEVELTLSNETRMIKSGDMVVQRSSLHKWRNPSETQWARVVGIVSECQP